MSRLTTAQALIRFLSVQEIEVDGERQRLFPAVLGIFGHGNVAGIGQALQQEAEAMPYIQGRNEQGMVHTAIGYARQQNRRQVMVCTSSVGPGATNMVTGAAVATVNRLPVLLLPGDTFAGRRSNPVLQQIEVEHDATVSANDAFRPVSVFFDRINRPEQLYSAAMEAVRILTDPAKTGAVTLALPEDVQSEAHDFDDAFLAPRLWRVDRRPPAEPAVAEAAEAIRAARMPLIVSGGGTIYSAATTELARFAEATGIPVAETQAGRGSLESAHELSLGAVGATGTLAANRIAAEADLVIGIGTRYSDFTTASNTAFRNPLVRFVNLNVTGLDAFKRSAIPVLGDARESLERLSTETTGYRVPGEWTDRIAAERREWTGIADELRADGEGYPLRQSAVIAAVNDAAGEDGVMVCAAGSTPGDLHKLWRATHPKAYHVEYGFSCMGYEVPGAIGVKMAAPDRPVFSIVGDGSWLMLPGELVTAVAERVGIVVVLLDNHGYASIGALSRSLGQSGFGTHYRARPSREQVVDSGVRPAGDAGPLPVDFAANAESLGAEVIRVRSMDELRDALARHRLPDHPVVIHTETDRYQGVPDFESWWDVPPAEISRDSDVDEARAAYEEHRLKQRLHLEGR